MLQSTTRETGNAILRRLLQAPWEMLDTTLTQDDRQRFSPEPIRLDGHEPIRVASSTLPRQAVVGLVEEP